MLIIANSGKLDHALYVTSTSLVDKPVRIFEKFEQVMLNLAGTKNQTKRLKRKGHPLRPSPEQEERWKILKKVSPA